MKKLSIIAAFAGIFISQLNTQAQGLYLGLGVGDGFPSQVASFQSATTTSSSSTSVTSESYSLGAGVAVGVYGGYMISKNFGIELGISDKFSSSKSSTAATSSIDTGFDFSSVTTGTDVYTVKGSLFRLTPGIRIATSCDGKLQGYSVIGLIIGFPSATFEDAGSSSTVTTTPAGTSTTSNVSDEITTYSGGMIIGFHGAVGAMYQLSDMMGIFLELNGNFQNWAPSQGLITTATVNGVDELANMTTSEKQTNYLSSYTVTASSSSPGSPRQAPLMYAPFSSWGLTVGIHFSFGGSSSK